MDLIAKTITALILIAVLSIDKSESECCDLSYVIHHVCMGIPTENHIPIHLILDFFWIDNKFEYWTRSETDEKRPKCVSHFCEDGSTVKGFNCGIGDCNMFGCACKGGCRKNNGTALQEFSKKWREDHGLLFKRKHHLKGTFE